MKCYQPIVSWSVIILSAGSVEESRVKLKSGSGSVSSSSQCCILSGLRFVRLLFSWRSVGDRASQAR